MSELEDLREICRNVGADVLGKTLTKRSNKLLKEHVLKLIQQQFPAKEDSGNADSGSTK
jgi:hypothetical protein